MMKPMVILPPDAMSAADIQLLRDNGLCVVVSQDPAKVKFLDPLPAASSRTEIENAAIGLSRRILNGQTPNLITRDTAAATFVNILVHGTALDPEGSKDEQEQRIFDTAKAEEIRELAREEARAERLAKKQPKPKA